MRILCKSCLRENDITQREFDAGAKCRFCNAQISEKKEKIPNALQSIVFQCPSCKTKYNIPPSKIPIDKEVKLQCKKCYTKTSVKFYEIDNEISIKYLPSKIEYSITAVSEKERISIDESSYTPPQDVDKIERIDLSKKYKVKSGTSIFGPLTYENMIKWIDVDMLSPDDTVSINNKDFYPASQYPELMKLFSEKEEEKVRELQFLEKRASKWSIRDMLYGIASGAISGFCIAFCIVLVVLLSKLLPIKIIFHPGYRIGEIIGAIFAFIFWIMIGSVLGGLYSLFEAVTLNKKDYIDIWNPKHFWIGAVLGTIIGVFAYINGDGILGFFLFVFLCTGMSMLLTIVHKYLLRYIIYKKSESSKESNPEQ